MFEHIFKTSEGAKKAWITRLKNFANKTVVNVGDAGDAPKGYKYTAPAATPETPEAAKARIKASMAGYNKPTMAKHPLAKSKAKAAKKSDFLSDLGGV